MPENKQNLTRFGAAKKIIGVSVPMIAAYTLSATVVVVLFLLSLLSENEEEKAGASLASGTMNITMVLGVALLLAFASRVAHYEGKIRDLKKVTLNKEEELENIEEISDEKSFRKLENNNLPVVSALGTTNTEELKTINNDFSEEECRDLVTSIFRGGLYMTPSLAALMMAIFFYSKEILVALGQNEEAAEYASEFLKVYALAVIGILLRITQEQVLFGLGHGKFVMAVAPIDFILCSILAVWLGFGGAGMPRLGPTGVAIAYDIESYLTSFFYFLRLMLSKSLQEYTFFNFCKQVRGARDEFWETFKRGAGILFALFNQLALTIGTTLFSGLLDDIDEATAWGAVLTLLSFFLIITTAFGQGCTMEVDGAIGEKNYKAASRLGTWGLIASQFIVTPPLLAITFFPQILSIPLRLDEAASQIFKTLIPIISLGLFASNIFFNLIQQERPLGRNWVSTLLPFLMTVIGVPAAWLLGVKAPSFISGIAGDLGIGIAYAVVTIGVATAVLGDWIKHIRPGAIEAHAAEIKAENEAKPLKASQEPHLPQQSSSWLPSWCCTFASGKKREEQQLLPVSSFASTK